MIRIMGTRSAPQERGYSQMQNLVEDYIQVSLAGAGVLLAITCTAQPAPVSPAGAGVFLT